MGTAADKIWIVTMLAWSVSNAIILILLECSRMIRKIRFEGAGAEGRGAASVDKRAVVRDVLQDVVLAALASLLPAGAAMGIALLVYM